MFLGKHYRMIAVLTIVALQFASMRMSTLQADDLDEQCYLPVPTGAVLEITSTTPGGTVPEGGIASASDAGIEGGASGGAITPAQETGNPTAPGVAAGTPRAVGNPTAPGVAAGTPPVVEEGTDPGATATEGDGDAEEAEDELGTELGVAVTNLDGTLTDSYPGTHWIAREATHGGTVREYIYRESTGTMQPVAVTSWTELQNAIATVNESGAPYDNNRPHVILIGGGFTLSGTVTVPGAANITLRKYDSAQGEEQWYNFGSNKGFDYGAGEVGWRTTRIDRAGGLTGNLGSAVGASDAVQTADLFDGTPDYFLRNSGSARHFNFTTSTSEQAKFTLENITLQGPDANASTDYTGNNNKAGTIGGGIVTTAQELSFAGNIRDCYTNANAAGGIYAGIHAAGINMFGGVLWHNRGGVGGGICGYWKDTASGSHSVRGYSVLMSNLSEQYGGALAAKGKVSNLVITDNVLIEDNTAQRGGGIQNGGGNITVDKNVVIRNNHAVGLNKGTMVMYPGRGGGIAFDMYTANGDRRLTIADNVVIEDNDTTLGGAGISVGSDGWGAGDSTRGFLLLKGGIIRNNINFGTLRQAYNETMAVRGAGGAIMSDRPSCVIIPPDSTVEFYGNDAPYISLIDVKALPLDAQMYRPLPGGAGWAYPGLRGYTADTYDNHILQSFSMRDSAMFPAPYDNLYNNFDIGSRNDASMVYGKLQVRATAGGYIADRRVTTPGEDFMNVFAPSTQMVGLHLNAGAEFDAAPALGYEFSHWTVESACLQPTAYGQKELKFAMTGSETGVVDTSDPSIAIHAMPAADISLTAHFRRLPTALLDGFKDVTFWAELKPAGYTPALAPGDTQPRLTNVGTIRAENVPINLSDCRLNGLPYTPGAGEPTQAIAVISGTAGIDPATYRDWVLQPAPGLKNPGAYSACMTLTYHDGVMVKTETKQVTFALIDPNKPLLVPGTNDFGSVIGSRYSVGNAQDDVVKRQPVAIDNWSKEAMVVNITLEGAQANAFRIIQGSSTIGGSPVLGVPNKDSSWAIEPQPGLPAGIYHAVLAIGYHGGNIDPKAPIKTVSQVLFMVKQPGLTINPAVHMFSPVHPGYVFTNIGFINIANVGSADATILSVKPVGNSGAFDLLPGNKAEVEAGGRDTGWRVSPRRSLSAGEYSEYFTVTYTYDDAMNGSALGRVEETLTFRARFAVMNDTYPIYLTVATRAGIATTFLGWTAPASGEPDYYRVEYRKNNPANGPEDNWTEDIGDLPGNVTLHSIPNLSWNTLYDFRVSAFSSGMDHPSAPQSAQMPPKPAPPPAPPAPPVAPPPPPPPVTPPVTWPIITPPVTGPISGGLFPTMPPASGETDPVDEAKPDGIQVDTPQEEEPAIEDDRPMGRKPQEQDDADQGAPDANEAGEDETHESGIPEAGDGFPILLTCIAIPAASALLILLSILLRCGMRRQAHKGSR
jgi:hypothetical protein